jgi:hypothetical protein
MIIRMEKLLNIEQLNQYGIDPMHRSHIFRGRGNIPARMAKWLAKAYHSKNLKILVSVLI